MKSDGQDFTPRIRCPAPIFVGPDWPKPIRLNLHAAAELTARYDHDKPGQLGNAIVTYSGVSHESLPTQQALHVLDRTPLSGKLKSGAQ